MSIDELKEQLTQITNEINQVNSNIVNGEQQIGQQRIRFQQLLGSAQTVQLWIEKLKAVPEAEITKGA